jgi:hypothetical protein
MTLQNNDAVTCEPDVTALKEEFEQSDTAQTTSTRIFGGDGLESSRRLTI